MAASESTKFQINYRLADGTYAKKALGGTTVVPDGAAPDCKHGSMAFRSGVGQKGPWKGWMCAAPKGAVDKCETVWIR